MREGQSFPERLCAAAAAPGFGSHLVPPPRCGSAQRTARPCAVSVGRQQQRTDRTQFMGGRGTEKPAETQRCGSAMR